jgi:hypothetical protein
MLPCCCSTKISVQWWHERQHWRLLFTRWVKFTKPCLLYMLINIAYSVSNVTICIFRYPFPIALWVPHGHFETYMWITLNYTDQMFTLTSASRPSLGPTQPPVQWVPGGSFSAGKMRPWPPSSAEIEKERSCTSSIPKARVKVYSGSCVCVCVKVKWSRYAP